MTALPTQGVFTNAATTNAVAKQAQDDMLAVLLEMLGGSGSADAEYEKTIAAGAITPTRGSHTVDTEADAASDNLDTIAVTNHPDGRFLIISPANDARTVVVRHLQGGTGQISLQDDANYSLDQVDKFLLAQRVGNIWEEVLRGFGSDLAAKLLFMLGSGGSADQQPVFDGATWSIAETPLPPGTLHGLGIANAADTDHDILIDVGEYRDLADAANVKNAAQIVKQIDVTWAAGGTVATPTGGLSSSLTLAADTWYAVMAGEVSGTVEAGYDTDPTGGNLVTDHSFTKLRRVGWVRTDSSSNIIGFLQIGDRVWWNARRQTVSAGFVTVEATISVATQVPVGAESYELAVDQEQGSGSGIFDVNIRHVAGQEFYRQRSLAVDGNANNGGASSGSVVLPNNSAQQYFYSWSSGATSRTTNHFVLSYIDRRGRIS